MSKTDITVGELVDKIRRGELRLPELQRRYIWPATRVRDLLDSLYRGYPSGAILVWESGQGAPEREMAVEQDKDGLGTQFLLLDGQQRLTSLSALVRAEPLRIKGRVRPIELAFNIDHPDGPPSEVLEVDDDGERPIDEVEPEEPVNGDDVPNVLERIRSRAFVVASQGILADPKWIKVSDIFNPSKRDWDLLKPLNVTPSDPAWDRYTRRLQRVRDIARYPYVMHVLERELPYEEVAEIFVRVNSLGMKLRGSDLALAQISARWPNSLDRFEEFAAECERRWFDFDIGLLVRTLVVFATKQSRFRTVNQIPVGLLESSWTRAKEGLRFTVNFLRANAGIENDSLLSSPLLVIPVAVFAMSRSLQMTEVEQRELLHWLFVANSTGHYSASSETILDADLNVLFRGGGPTQLLDLVKQQFGRIRFTDKDFAMRSPRNPLYSTTYLALRHAGAKDWGSGLVISLTHQGRTHAIESHHIFPKAMLADKGFDKAEINEIANLAFISGGKNRMLGIKAPDIYLPLVVKEKGEQSLAAQRIPLAPELWRLENFREFLAARRRDLASAVNEFLDSIAEEGRTTADPVSLIVGGETDAVEFKETARFNRHTGAADKAMEGAVAKTVAGFLNGRGGTLFIGVNDQGVVVGIVADLGTLTARPDVDGYQQFLRQMLSDRLGAATCAHLDVSFPVVDDRQVCMVRVPLAGKPAYLTEGSVQQFYVRIGNTTRPLNIGEAHEYIRTRFPSP